MNQTRRSGLTLLIVAFVVSGCAATDFAANVAKNGVNIGDGLCGGAPCQTGAGQIVADVNAKALALLTDPVNGPRRASAIRFVARYACNQSGICPAAKLLSAVSEFKNRVATATAIGVEPSGDEAAAAELLGDYSPELLDALRQKADTPESATS